MKINLPDMPVDRFEVVGFLAYSDFVEELKWVFHVNTDWDELYPDDKPKGLPLQNEWQIIRDGRFVGRSLSGWNAITKFDWQNAHESKADAIREMLSHIQANLKAARNRVASLETLEESVIYQLDGVDHPDRNCGHGGPYTYGLCEGCHEGDAPSL